LDWLDLITDALKLITKPRCLARYSLTLAAATLAAFALVACGGATVDPTEPQDFASRVTDLTTQASALSDELNTLGTPPATADSQLQELAAQLRELTTQLADAPQIIPADQLCVRQPDPSLTDGGATPAPVYATADAPFANLNGFTDIQPNQRNVELIMNSFRTNLDASIIYCAEFETEDGVFVAELYPACSPIAVGAFVYLAQSGFYDGLTFHHVIENTIAVGGDRAGTGAGNPGFFFDDPSCPELRHNRAGTISLVNAGMPQTTGSQFLITMATGPYTAAWDTYDASGAMRDCNAAAEDGARTTCYPVIGRIVRNLENVLTIDPRDPDTATAPGERIRSIRITQQDIDTQLVTPFAAFIPQVAEVERDYAELDRDLSYTAIFETNRGSIIAELYPQCSPIAVANFTYLANGGFYDNIQFHRVIDNFVVQGGDPTATGAGGPPYSFGELSCSDYTHNTQGVISMANSGSFNTNGSQFFIAKATNDISRLDMYDANGDIKNCAADGVSCHPIFGAVTSGMDVVNSIVQGDTLRSVTVATNEP